MKTYSPPRLAPKAVGLAIALAFCAAPAVAQNASVYISSFTYETSMSPTGEVIDLLWSDPFQSLHATALNGGGLFGSQAQSFEPLGYLPAIGFANTSNALATYSAPGDQTFYLTAATTNSAYPVGTPRNEATASGSNSGVFSLSAPGTVTFTVDYSLGVNRPGGNAVSDFSSAFVHFNAMSDDGLSGDDQSADLFSFSQLSGVGTLSGTFTFTVALAADQLGFYTLDGGAQSFSAAVAAPVPEPHEWALMLAGFAALGAYSRRRKATHA